MVVRAVGGDPHRELELDEDCVARLADELATDGRMAQLQAGLSSLRHLGEERPAVREALAVLAAEPDVAWRAFVAALLANELAE